MPSSVTASHNARLQNADLQNASPARRRTARTKRGTGNVSPEARRLPRRPDKRLRRWTRHTALRGVPSLACEQVTSMWQARTESLAEHDRPELHLSLFIPA